MAVASPPRGGVTVIRAALAAAAVAVLVRPALADPADLDVELDLDLDGDGDVDADDRALLDAAESIEVIDVSDGQALRESARAVTVIDTRVARERAADLGEVLSRAQGLQVRRDGALGSTARLSLNGLYDQQIRLFLDGVPLELAGWGAGVANVPVELLERVDVHRGVVPVSLGADALGGAIDLITDPSWVNRAAASYQLGSFGTHRVSLATRARDARTGAAAGLSLFLDHADNDYPVDVQVPDEQGQLHPRTVRRFHDAYTAAGANGELGLVDRGVVRRALVRLFATDAGKQLQHNLAMTVPYGDARHGETSRGATVDVALESPRWKARALAGASWRQLDFDDRGQTIYDWSGARIGVRRRAGELGEATFRRLDQVAGFARLTVERALGERHTLRLAVAPTTTRRTGEDFLDTNPDGRDPASAERALHQLVTGVEHEVRGARLHNVAFAKHYAMWTTAEELRAGFQFVPLRQRAQRFGLGDGLRYRLGRHLALKASYEWAARLPSVDELFGDGVLVEPNLALAPERSHNLNAGARYQRTGDRGELAVEGNLFARLADRMIVLLGDDRFFMYQNVFSARIVGVEGTAAWASPGGRATLDGTVTVQDLRNVSDQGTFGAYAGDRIPNRPWLLGSVAGSLRTRDLARRNDELIVFAASRYVREFFRSWESAGLREFKQVVPSQLVHTVGVTYAARGSRPVVTTVELQNLTDARVYDSYGVQRPGRAVFVKLSAEL